MATNINRNFISLAKCSRGKILIPGFLFLKLDRDNFVSIPGNRLCSMLFVIIIIESGQLEVTIGNVTHTLSSAGDNAAVVKMGSVLNSLSVSDDCKGGILAFDDHFLVSNLSLIKYIPVQDRFTPGDSISPTFAIGQNEIRYLFTRLEDFERTFRAKDNIYWGDLLRLAAVDIHLRIMNALYQSKSMAIRNIRDDGRQGELFRRFMLCLYDNVRTQREVSYYAEKLCISPKYLNVITKNVSGRKASDIIGELAVLTASQLLRNKRLSVAQVAHEMSFASQATFTRYFKKLSGYTPSEFRYRF